MRAQRIEARLSLDGGDFGFLAALVRGGEAGIELANFTARGVGFRAKTLRARGLDAAFALGLAGRSSGLGVRVP